MNEQVEQFLEQGRQSLQSGQFSAALEQANQAILIDSSSADAHLIRAIALSQLRQPDAASEAFSEAIRLDPTNGKAYYNMAVHLYGQGKRDLALQACKDAIERDPSQYGAQELKSRIEAETGASATASSAAGAAPPAGGYADYSRGTASSFQPQVHSIAFVENMGEEKWKKIGLGILIGRVVWFVISMVIAVTRMMSMFSDPAAMQRQQANPFAMYSDPSYMVTNMLGLLFVGITMAWTFIDIADRRGNWIWVLPYVVGCCCGLDFAVTGIYIATGRK